MLAYELRKSIIMEPTLVEPIVQAPAAIVTEQPVDENKVVVEEEEDDGEDLLTKELKLLSLVDQSTDPEVFERKWVAESKAFYDQEKAQEDKRYTIFHSTPDTDEGWKKATNEVFGPASHELRKSDFCFARSSQAPSQAVKTEKDWFLWLQRSEQYMIKGARTVDWVDPLLDERYDARSFREIVPLGVGYDYAVILADKPTKNEGDDDGGDKHTWSMYTARLTASDPRYVNSVSRRENLGLLQDKSNNNSRLAAIRRMNTIAYHRSTCGTLPRPSHGATHGKHVSLYWSRQNPLDKTRRDREVLRIYRLPKLSPEDMVELPIPQRVGFTHYEVHWPLLVFACSNQYLFDIPWVADLQGAQAHRGVEKGPPCDLIVVVDLEKRILLRSWGATGRVNCLSLYPSGTSVSEESIPLDQVKVLWNIDMEEGHELDKYTLESFLVKPVTETSNDIPADYYWRSGQEELALKAKHNFAFKSPPNESCRMIRRSANGHTVQISTNNVSVKVAELKPLFPGDQIYFGRDFPVIDRCIHLNTCYTLLPDYTVQFSCIRAADPKDAVKAASQFCLKDLKDYGEVPNKNYPPPRQLFYKAIWTSVSHVVFQFPDGTLLFSHAMDEVEMARYKRSVAEARKQEEDKKKLQQLVESKTWEAILQEAKA